MKKHFPLLLLLACATLFVGTFYLLLRDRFESGDVYPPSSSLRSDPLGTMILFESLQAFPGLHVDRDHSANRLPDGHRTTYLHFAADSSDWTWMPVDLYNTVDRFLLQGGRLVITFAPQYLGRWHEPDEKKEDDIKEKEEKKDKEAPPKENEKKPKKEKKDSEPKYIDLREKWGIGFSWEQGKKGDEAAWNVSTLPLPPELKWHGHIILQDPDASWKILYKNALGPVLAERKRGAGSIVIATDSYFVSNEALVRDRQPALLSWLVGSSDHIVFDEAHFGIVDAPGIAALAHKYRLHGGVAALLILAGLFIWKNSSSLVPSRVTLRDSADVIPGHAAGAGFVSLLRRNISSDRVFGMCLHEWRKAFAHGARFTPRQKAAFEEIAREEESRPVRDRDPVGAYQKICAVLRRRASSSLQLPKNHGN